MHLREAHSRALLKEHCPLSAPGMSTKMGKKWGWEGEVALSSGSSLWCQNSHLQTPALLFTLAVLHQKSYFSGPHLPNRDDSIIVLLYNFCEN